MKKFFSIILLIFCIFSFSGCSDELINLVKNNTSDLRINYFESASENMFANLSCGYREEVFAYDGISTNKLECGVLTVGFFTMYSYSSISVILNVDGDEKEYVLAHSPYEDVFMVDIEKILTDENIINLRLKNSDEKMSLQNVSKDWKIQYEDALKIAVESLKEDLSKLYFSGRLNAEGYLKIISQEGFDKVYWYFSYFDRSGNTNSLIIDVNTGEIVKKSY